MGHLRINGELFELPPDLCGWQHVYTAVMRGAEYVGVSVQGTSFSFDHPAMRQLLRELNDPSEPRMSHDYIVERAIRGLRKQFADRVVT
ncbi:MAG: hypothetical protein PHE68_01320 [Candidatus Peribacteraceae bacterium]|nr:hypothetical protein [Candidatus Peribacteraceae bacterium]